jgi:cytochrome c-type biogenesis protein CcmH/NrfG
MKTGLPDEGVREMQRALANDPNHRPTLLSLGRYLVGAGKARDALAILKGGASRWGDDAELLLLLGEAASDAGDRAEAIRALEAAERLRPDDAQIRQRLETLRASGDDAESGVERP